MHDILQIFVSNVGAGMRTVVSIYEKDALLFVRYSGHQSEKITSI